MPAFFIAAVRSGPLGIQIKFRLLAFSHGDSYGTGHHLVCPVLDTAIWEITGIAKLELVPSAEPSVSGSSGRNTFVQTSQESAIGQTYSIFRAYRGAVINRRVSHETPLGYTALAP